MSQINCLTSVMHKFTPQGQEAVINLLKENRALLNQKFGYAKLPTIISDKGLCQSFEKELVDKNDTIIKIVSDILANFYKTTPKTLKETITSTCIQFKEKCDCNPRGKAALEASKHFEAKKQKAMDILDKNGCVLLKSILKNCETSENIDKIAKSLETLVAGYLITHPIDFLKALISKYGKTNIELTRKLTGVMIEIHKILLNPSADRRVKNIEKFIKEKYGLQYVHLDNYADAKRVLQALEIAKKHNVPISEQIIVTPFMHHEKGGVNCILNNAILLNLRQEKELIPKFINGLDDNFECKKYIQAVFAEIFCNSTSTSNSLHNIIHEFVHNENPAARLKIKLPEKYRSVVDKLGEYASSSFNKDNEELRTELRVKQILEYLTPEEDELLKILQDAIPK